MSAGTVIAEESKGITEKLDAVFAPWNRSDAPGLTVGVAKGQTVMYRRGFGMASLETSVANSPKTRMRIASISKQFTCMLALLLVEEGKLSLDTPIRTYIPELTGPSGDPTLRQLMQHRGGSHCCFDIGFITHGMTLPPLGALLATDVRQKGRNFVPGEAMIYNTGGYQLLSLAIERIGGAPFEMQLKQRLFDPVGMVDTALIPSDYEITPGIATLHIPLPGGGWRRGIFPCEEKRGEGAIVSTIDDLLRWTAILRSRDRLGSPATWAALTERPIFPDGTVGVYALGLMLRTYRGLRTIEHAGEWIGGFSQMLTFPDNEIDIVILSNGAPGADPVKLAEQVADVVLAGQLAEATPTVAAAGYQALLGDWWSPSTGMIYSLMDEKGELKLSVCIAPVGQTLERLPDGRVVLPASSMGEIAVELDEALRSEELTIRFGGHGAVYRKGSTDNVKTNESFAQASVGRYHSDDGNATATIARDGQRLVVVIADPYGRTEWLAHPLSEEAAYIEPTIGLRHYGMNEAALLLTLKNGHVTGFRLNTGPTRNLVFDRM